ncbi:RWD domain-containing protein 1-like isoform X2 [Pollicipes pollicipes]|uniref:RWD domain-containing protein 1-like isoform X2 n=1 Tax=Pollicipes pollicipes TaxID=41117 RepID=UPI001884F840|nr:RWD domain-containing protein 1-like isoform X2 [Pollicipes pollicipes]
MDINYAEEQENELEALQSIYPDELEVVGPGQYQIAVKSMDYDLDPAAGCRCLLAITCPARYPDEAPQIDILEEPENCVPLEVEQLMETLQAEAEANLGMVMVFTIASAASEWLNNHCDELRRRKEEEAERKRFEGTRVSVETFLKWKEGFEKEMSAMRAQKARDLEAARRNKLSGRELFLKDTTLVDSDIKFLEDAGEDVKVDESLFQDLEDLDLEDDELAELSDT